MKKITQKHVLEFSGFHAIGERDAYKHLDFFNDNYNESVDDIIKITNNSVKYFPLTVHEFELFCTGMKCFDQHRRNLMHEAEICTNMASMGFRSVALVELIKRTLRRLNDETMP